MLAGAVLPSLSADVSVITCWPGARVTSAWLPVPRSPSRIGVPQQRRPFQGAVLHVMTVPLQPEQRAGQDAHIAFRRRNERAWPLAADRERRVRHIAAHVDPVSRQHLHTRGGPAGQLGHLDRQLGGRDRCPHQHLYPALASHITPTRCRPIPWVEGEKWGDGRSGLAERWSASA